MHLTCSNVPKQTVVEVLKEARALGIRNLLAVRGGTWSLSASTS